MTERKKTDFELVAQAIAEQFDSLLGDGELCEAEVLSALRAPPGPEPTQETIDEILHYVNAKMKTKKSGSSGRKNSKRSSRGPRHQRRLITETLERRMLLANDLELYPVTLLAPLPESGNATKPYVSDSESKFRSGFNTTCEWESEGKPLHSNSVVQASIESEVKTTESIAGIGNSEWRKEYPELYSVEQVFFLNFGGATVEYDGPEKIELDIPSFDASNSGLGGKESKIVNSILNRLKDEFRQTNVVFTDGRPSENDEYSTIFIGGDNSSFSVFGSFLGLAERIDTGNLHSNDNALVFSETIMKSLETNEIDSHVGALVEVIVHEAAHLVGASHESHNSSSELHNLALSTPILFSPDNNEPVSTRPLLDWNTVVDATSYRVVVATSSSALPRGSENPGAGIALNQVVSNGSSRYTPTSSQAFSDGTTYYWTVRAGNSSEGSLWSSIRSFTTTPAGLPAPTLRTPSNGATLQATRPNFDWDSVGGSNTYRILVSTSLGALPTGDQDPSGSFEINRTTSSSAYTRQRVPSRLVMELRTTGR